MSVRLRHRASSAATFTAFLHRQLIRKVPALPSTDLSTKVAIVTGSNVGLGLECARHLLSLRVARLILAVRSQSKGAAAAQELQAAFPDSRIEVWTLDLASYPSVLDFVRRCHVEMGKIDIAILNAGMVQQHYNQCTNPDARQSHETIFQVNYLSTVLLAVLLLPLLRRSRASSPEQKPTEPGRLTIVGSDTSYWANPRGRHDGRTTLFQTADDSDEFDGFDRYKSAKLFVMMFVAKLCRDFVSSDDVVVNVACPGLCKGTAFTREQDANVAKRVAFAAVMRLIGRSAPRGARVYVDAAVTQGPESEGSMLSEGIILPYPPIIYEHPYLVDQLWNETMKELEFAGVEKILASVSSKKDSFSEK